MIKSNELRLNNWVNCYGINFPVTAINFTHVEGAANDGEFAVQDLQPIQLTPEILSKICTSVESFHDGVMLYKFDIGTFWTQSSELWFEISYGKILSDIKYVHQLQNLFYYLTNIELTITL